MTLMRSATIVLLLLATGAHLYGLETQQLASSASISLDENGTVSVSGGKMQDLELNLSIPLTSEYQQVQVSAPVSYDPEGNPYVVVSEKTPGNPYTYSMKVNVQTLARNTKSLPDSYVTPPAYSAYLASTARTQSSNQQIKELALKITENAQDPFEKVAMLAIWVNENLEYNEQLVGDEHDALWALQNRQGVCVEYSTLFTALARSINIPARYVTGYSYSERFNGWLGHAWAEAYIGKWVPVDPTWFEVGSLDAVHVEAGKYAEISKEPALTVFVSPPGAGVEWQTTGRSGAFANNIATNQVSYSTPESNFKLEVIEPELAPGGTTLAFLSIVGEDYRVVLVSLASCTGGTSIEVKGGDQYLILRPGQTSTAVWELKASTGLADNYVYTCPLTLNSPYLENRILDVNVDPRIANLADYSASLEEKNTKPGQQNSVILSLPKARQGKFYTVISKSGVYEKRISSSAGSIGFFSTGIGNVPVYVAGTGGGFLRLEYVSGDEASITIDSFTVQELAVVGKPATAFAYVSAETYPADVELDFTLGYKVEKAAGRISKPTKFEFEFMPQEIGAQTAKLVATAGAASDEKNQLVEVIEPPDISIESVDQEKKGDRVLTKITFSKTGRPVSPKIEIAGETYPVYSNLEVGLVEGEYEAKLSWEDPAGNKYVKTGSFTVKSPGLFDTNSEGCILAPLLIFFSFAAAFSRR